MRAAVLVTVLAACASEPPKPAWLAQIDDARSLAELSIPGTHESAALYEPIAGAAKCQSLTIEKQLAAGVRYFDVRCRHMYDAFAIYHGPVDQLQTFDDVLATMYAFLDAHPTETIIASIKEESEPVAATRSFEATFATYVERDPDRWHLADTVPVLGDVRGKIVLLRRFDATAPTLGLDASAWADNTTFSIFTNASSLRIQDAYRVEDPATKWDAIVALLDEAATSEPATLFLNYTSGYESRGGIPNNVAVADAINPLLDVALRERPPARTGVLAMDHVDVGRVQAVIRTNGIEP